MIFLKNNQTGEIVQFINADSIGEHFQNTSWEIMPEVESAQLILQQNKELKIVKLISNRKIKQYETIDYNGYILYGTEKARGNIFQARDLLPLLNMPSTPWLDIDSNPITFTQEDFLNLCRIFLQKDSTLYMQEASKILSINSCLTQEELDSVDISF